MKHLLASLLRTWAERLDPKPAPQISITYTTSPNLGAVLKGIQRATLTNRCY